MATIEQEQALAWTPPIGCVEVEPGVFEDPSGRVFVDAGTWAEWSFRSPAQVDREREQRRRWLQHNGWYRPTLEEWRMYCGRQREVIAFLVDELHWQRLETVRALAGWRD
jgi:hypothetical protein